MGKKTINLTLDRDLWTALAKRAYEESHKSGERFPTIGMLRTAIKTFLRMQPEEINNMLKRDTRYGG